LIINQRLGAPTAGCGVVSCAALLFDMERRPHGLDPLGVPRIANVWIGDHGIDNRKVKTDFGRHFPEKPRTRFEEEQAECSRVSGGELLKQNYAPHLSEFLSNGHRVPLVWPICMQAGEALILSDDLKLLLQFT